MRFVYSALAALVVAGVLWFAGESHRSNCINEGRRSCSVLPWDNGTAPPLPAEPPAPPPAPPPNGMNPRREPAPEGTSARDDRTASDVVRYFRRNFRVLYWYGHIERVQVKNGVITVVTDLAMSGNDRFAARQICDGIQGSDVADFTPGHSVVGRNGAKVRCPARRDQ